MHPNNRPPNPPLRGWEVVPPTQEYRPSPPRLTTIWDVVAEMEARIQCLEEERMGLREVVAANPKMTYREIILLWLRGHATMDARYLSSELAGIPGLGATSDINHALAIAAGRMVKDGCLIRIRPGTFRLDPTYWGPEGLGNRRSHDL